MKDWLVIVVALLMTLVAAPGCQKNAAPRAEVVVTRVKVSVTNPSLPPQSRSGEVEYELEPSHVDAWEALMERVLDQTKVNGEVTLREHIAMGIAQDQEGLKRVREAVEAEPQPVGGTQRDMSFWNGTKRLYWIDDSYTYEGEALGELRDLVYKKGTKYELDSNPEPFDEDEDQPTVIEPTVVEPTAIER